MKLNKNGYRSEKRDSFATAVKVLTFIFGVGVVVAAVCLYGIFSGCGGGGSDNSSPVYDENGVCVNCNGNGDASVMPEDGYTYLPVDITVDQQEQEYVAPPCKVPTDPKIKKMCMPYGAKSAICVRPTPDNSTPPCENNPGYACHCFDMNHMNHWKDAFCTTDADCHKKIQCEDWPPEVCWGLPCQLAKEWICDESIFITDFTLIEYYDNKDGYCRIHFPPEDGLSFELYYKPGNDHLQNPPSGSFEEKYTFLDNGNQMLVEVVDGYDFFSFTCVKLVEEWE